jgi:hypothetical protein
MRSLSAAEHKTDKHKCPNCKKEYSCLLRISKGKWQEGDCSYRRDAYCAKCLGVPRPMDRQGRVFDFIKPIFEEATKKKKNVTEKLECGCTVSDALKFIVMQRVS